MVPATSSESALKRAIRLAGSQSKLAQIVGRSQPTVSLWVKGDMKLPAECVLSVEAALGIPRYELRPDIYPPEEHVPASQAPAQVPSAQPSAPSAQKAPQPPAGVDGPLSAPDTDPLEGMAA